MTATAADLANYIARAIMASDRREDPRFLVFNLWRAFSAAPEELVLGMGIAVEIYESTEVGPMNAFKQKPKGGRTEFLVVDGKKHTAATIRRLAKRAAKKEEAGR
jgi:hypothetical protein